MPAFRPCPECGGQRVQVDYTLTAHPSSLIRLKQYKRSVNWFKGKSHTSDTTVITCMQCGYTAWFATEPQNLIPDG